MDGLLIDSEDLYTIVTNEVLHEYGKPDLPWHIKAQLQGRPGPEVRWHCFTRPEPLSPRGQRGWKVLSYQHEEHRQAVSSGNGHNSPSPNPNS